MDKKSLLEELKKGRYYFQKGSLFVAIDIKTVIVDDFNKDEEWFIDFQNGSFSMNINKIKEVKEIPFFQNAVFRKVYKIKCSYDEEIGFIGIQ